MPLEKYKYSVSDNHLDFEFASLGPKGKVRAIVRYSPQNVEGTTYFNLAFGGLDPVTGKIEELVLLNNQDREMVLAAIAATVLEFTRHFPDMMVFTQEITPIGAILSVYGYEQNKGWQPLRKNTNYKAFFIERKPAKPKSNVKVKDHGNDPFFVKKAAASKAFLEKHGFPEYLSVKK